MPFEDVSTIFPLDREKKFFTLTKMKMSISKLLVPENLVVSKIFPYFIFTYSILGEIEGVFQMFCHVGFFIRR